MKLKKNSIVLLLTFLPSAFLIGCDQTGKNNSSPTTIVNSLEQTNRISTSETNLAEPDRTNATTYSADNSGINSRDRDTNLMTAVDQGDSPSDVEITQKIRKSLMMDTNFSTTAKNIKIITKNGNVTLRGPVNSEAEKNGIEMLAKNLAGEGKVDNQLDVLANK